MIKVSMVTIIGTIIASILNYMIGRSFYDHVCRDGRCDRYVSLYHKHGRYGLMLAALGPIPYVPFCWFSGAFGMKPRRFLYFGIIPRIIRIAVVSYIIMAFF